jgi:kynureninase
MRGGHLSITHDDAAQIALAMRQLANVIPDFRKPNTIRVAVAPLYTSYEEIFIGFQRLRDLVATGDFQSAVLEESAVT